MSKQKLQVKSFDLQKESIKSEVRNSNLFETNFLNFQKHVQVHYLNRGDRNKEFGIGFIGFGQTSKK